MSQYKSKRTDGYLSQSVLFSLEIYFLKKIYHIKFVNVGYERRKGLLN